MLAGNGPASTRCLEQEEVRLAFQRVGYHDHGPARALYRAGFYEPCLFLAVFDFPMTVLASSNDGPAVPRVDTGVYR